MRLFFRFECQKILGFRPQKFLARSEIFPANLENVKKLGRFLVNKILIFHRNCPTPKLIATDLCLKIVN